MNEHEKSEFVTVIKALDEEEKAIAIKFFPSDLIWDELKRRDQVERNTLKRVREALKVEEDE